MRVHRLLVLVNYNLITSGQIPSPDVMHPERTVVDFLLPTVPLYTILATERMRSPQNSVYGLRHNGA